MAQRGGTPGRAAMLKSLYDYAIRNGLALPPGYVKKEIKAWILLYADGSFQGIEKGIPLSRNARSYLEKHKKLSGLQYDAFTKMTENQDKLETISPYFENDDVINEFIIGCDDVIYDKATPDEAAQRLYEKFSEYISAAVKK